MRQTHKCLLIKPAETEHFEGLGTDQKRIQWSPRLSAWWVDSTCSGWNPVNTAMNLQGLH